MGSSASPSPTPQPETPAKPTPAVPAPIETDHEQAGSKNEDEHERLRRKRDREGSIEPRTPKDESDRPPPATKRNRRASDGSIRESDEDAPAAAAPAPALPRSAVGPQEGAPVQQIREKVRDLEWKDGEEGIGEREEQGMVAEEKGKEKKKKEGEEKAPEAEADKPKPAATSFSAFASTTSPFAASASSNPPTSAAAPAASSILSPSTGAVPPTSKPSSSSTPTPAPASSFSAFASKTSGFGSYSTGSAFSAFADKPPEPSKAAKGTAEDKEKDAAAFGDKLASVGKEEAGKAGDAAGAGKLDLTPQDVPTGEEDEQTVSQIRCKLYLLELPAQTWKERGTGLLKLNTRKADGGRPRLIMRADGVYRVILNVPLFTGQSVALVQERYLRFTGLDEGQMRSFMVRFGNPKMASDMHDVIQAHLPRDADEDSDAKPAPKLSASREITSKEDDEAPAAAQEGEEAV